MTISPERDARRRPTAGPSGRGVPPGRSQRSAVGTAAAAPAHSTTTSTRPRRGPRLERAAILRRRRRPGLETQPSARPPGAPRPRPCRPASRCRPRPVPPAPRGGRPGPAPGRGPRSPASMTAGSNSELQHAGERLHERGGVVVEPVRQPVEQARRHDHRLPRSRRPRPEPMDSRSAHSIGRPVRHQRHAPQVAKAVSGATAHRSSPGPRRRRRHRHVPRPRGRA